MGLSLRGQTSGAVDINAPAVAGDNTITLPDGNGSANQFYKNSTTAGIVTHSSMVEDANGNITVGGAFSLGTGTSISSPSSNVLALGTNDNEGIRITSTGGVGVNTTTVPAGVNVAVGGTIRVQDSTDATQYLTITHQGIDFQNTGAGSSTGATNHLLDDYEEGTFTPGLSYETPGTSSFSYAAQTNGHYTRVGRLVYCKIEVRLTSFTKGTASGHLQVTGLPFTSVNSTWGQHIGMFASFNAPLPTGGGETPIFIVYLNNDRGSIRYLVNNNAWSIFPDPDSNSQYKLSCVYHAV